MTVAQQIWVVSAPSANTNLMAVFDSTWTKEEVVKALKARFYNLREFSMQRMTEGSCVVQALDGCLNPEVYDQDLNPVDAGLELNRHWE